MKFSILLLFFLASQIRNASAAPFSVPSTFFYQGVATDGNGTPIVGPINLKVQVGAKNSANTFCVLWEEIKSAIPVNTTGGFQIEIGTGGSTYNLSFLSALNDTNYASVSPPTDCGSSFSVVGNKFVRVHYDNGSTFVALSPDVSLASSPYSAVAQTIQGKTTTDLILTNSSTAVLTQANAETIFSSSNFPILQALLAGTSSLYGKTGQALSNPTIATVGTIGSPVAGMQVYETSTNQIKVYNGSTWNALSTGGGSVSNVSSSNSYLTVANQTTTPILTLNIGTVANTLAAGDDSRFTTAALTSASNTFTTSQSIVNSANIVSLLLKGAAGQTSNLLEVKNNAGTMLYSIESTGTPTASTDLVNKAYMNTFVSATYLPKAGGTLTGAVVSSGALTINNNIISNAQIQSGPGSAGGPGVTSGPDTTTGIYYPTTGSIALTTAGSNRFQIDPSGYVGIGTMAPISIFHVSKPAGATDAIVSSGTASTASLLLTGPVGSSYPGAHLTYNGATNSLQIGKVTSGSIGSYPWMEMNGANGQFQMTAVTGASVDVKFSMRRANGFAAVPANSILAGLYFDGYKAGSYSTGAAGIMGIATENWSGSYNGAAMTFNTTNNGSSSAIERMRIDNNGNVGIGTVTPTAPLEVNGMIKTTSSGYGLYQNTGSYGISVGVGAGYGQVGTETNHKLALTVNQTDRLTINTSGNVGIGTTSPATSLQVEGVISPATNNVYSLGNAAFRFTDVYATNGTINTSDRREKKDITNSDLGLDFINKLRPVSYRWNTGVDNEVHYGLIAQEAKQALLELRTSQKTSIVTHDETTDRYGVRYTELISPLIKAIQELFSKALAVGLEQERQTREIASIQSNKTDMDLKIQQLNVENNKIKKQNEAIKFYLCSKEPSAEFCN